MENRFVSKHRCPVNRSKVWQEQQTEANWNFLIKDKISSNFVKQCNWKVCFFNYSPLFYLKVIEKEKIWIFIFLCSYVDKCVWNRHTRIYRYASICLFVYLSINVHANLCLDLSTYVSIGSFEKLSTKNIFYEEIKLLENRII